jgi:dipeptidyl aminopeptidase/acylaminoacyl peptidase
MHKARTPTLLLQGAEDQRCQGGQSEEIFTTLMRSSEVAVEMVLYPGESHHLAEESTPTFRVDYVFRLVEWVDRRQDDRGTDVKKPAQSSSVTATGST